MVSSNSGDQAKQLTSCIAKLSSVIAIGLLLSACANSSPDTLDAESNQVVSTNTVVDPDDAISSDVDTNPTTTAASDLQSSSQMENDLRARLQTSFRVDDGQLIPESGWICNDVFDQNITYFFYPEGVLDANRNVAVERLLVGDDAFTDSSFFWSVNGPDSLLLTAVVEGDGGTFLSNGLQYDVSNIRFTEVDSIASFNADSVFRGRLVCAMFDV